MRDPVAEPRPYQRVYAHLRGRIEQGELAHGAQLPSQPALAAEYGVALLTVRHAIELLRRAGYVSVEHGRGTFVTDPRGADTVLVVDDDARLRSMLVEQVAYAGQLGVHRSPHAHHGRHRAAATGQATLSQRHLRRSQRLP
jgi:DNA-binding FadR family transcriptional regulator